MEQILCLLGPGLSRGSFLFSVCFHAYWPSLWSWTILCRCIQPWEYCRPCPDDGWASSRQHHPEYLLSLLHLPYISTTLLGINFSKDWKTKGGEDGVGFVWNDSAVCGRRLGRVHRLMHFPRQILGLQPVHQSSLPFQQSLPSRSASLFVNLSCVLLTLTSFRPHSQENIWWGCTRHVTNTDLKSLLFPPIPETSHEIVPLILTMFNSLVAILSSRVGRLPFRFVALFQGSSRNYIRGNGCIRLESPVCNNHP